MDTIDWTKYVDAIWCISYIKYKNRREECEKELEFMDILHSPIFNYYYTFTNKFEYMVLDQVKPAFRDYHNHRRDIALNVMMAYHNLLRMAQDFGYKKVLIVEDDLRFVRDKQRMIDTLEHLPEEWDYIQFDKIQNHENYKMLSSLEPGPYFNANYTGGYWGTAFCMWGNKGIDVAVEVFEKDMVVSDYVLANRDDPRLNGLKRFVPTRHLMWQADQHECYFNRLY